MNKYLDKLFPKNNIAENNSAPSTKQILIGSYKLNANADHSLEIYLKEYPHYSQNFPRIVFELLKDKPGNTIIDIGANIGDTIALLRNYNVGNHVFCVEGDEIYFEFLSKNAEQFENVTLLKYYLTDKEEDKKYTVEKENGTARIIETNDNAIQSSLITLDKLSGLINFQTVGIIKIDTDGFDCKIIRGGLDLIEKHKPVLFFEYDYDLSKKQNENPLKTLSVLKDKGYSDIIYFDNYGRIICATTLQDDLQLMILDAYIRDGKGTFPYYDVLVFHQSDRSSVEKIVANEVKLITSK